jgi:drug/metabolite transporter (DMT)-like permease
VALVGLRSLARARDGRGGTIGAALVTANLIACIATLPMALPVATITAADVIVLVYLGVVQVGVGYACLASGVRHVPALEASLLLLLEPALNPLWAWAILAEAPSPWTIAGGAVILFATAVRTWRGARRRD